MITYVARQRRVICRSVGLLLLSAAHAHVLLADDKVIKAEDFPQLMCEIMLVQENLLSATIPRPFGSNVTNHCNEAIRRFEIVIDTWDDYQRGLSDAGSEASRGNLYLKGTMPLNEAEREYVATLSSKYDCGFEQASAALTNISDIAYVYGFNTAMGKVLASKYGRHSFGYDIGRAVTSVYGEGFEPSYSSAFFIPWRFAEPMENIRGKKRESRPRAAETENAGIRISPSP